MRFPFGHGMFYASFRYTNKSIKKIDKYQYELSIRVHNDSDFDVNEGIYQLQLSKNADEVIKSFKVEI